MYFAIVGTMVMEAIVKAQAGRITQNRRTMKVSELIGVPLDYWVAKALGRDIEPGWEWKVPAYSDDWLKGGPIIDRERIDIAHYGREIMPSLWEVAASINAGLPSYGETTLIAAMRAYVASKYGDEVPDNPA